jgi:hypothetical protein
MKKNFLCVLFAAALFMTIAGIQTGCSNSPAAPAATPTPVPTVLVSGNITIPSVQTGKNIWVRFYSSLADLSSPDHAFGTVCTSNPAPYSLIVKEGSYYIVSFVDVDNNQMATAGDYAGVYGVTWPAWPASKNAAVSASADSFDITLAVTSNNLTGTITIPANQTGKQFWVLLEPDTNGGNSNYAGFQMSTCPAGTEVPYSMVVLIPGTYYLYGGVNVDSSSGPPNAGDYIGFYGAAVPYYASLASSNVVFDPAALIVRDFNEQAMP